MPDVSIKSLVDQLWEFYQLEEHHKNRIDKVEADKYHEKLLRTGNIIFITEGNLLLGYVEGWKLTYEQFGRIICGEPFSAYLENVQNGHIAYVANTFILPEYRNGKAYKMLREKFIEMNKDCTHFCGHARRKKSEPVKVFKRKDM